MQLSPASIAASSHVAVAAAPVPARDRVRPMLPADVRDAIPDVLLDARIGRGTVASEYDRAIRVRLEGGGPPSERSIVPETTAAKQLLQSPAGGAFERMVRSSSSVVDASRGTDDLRSYTLVPDEHAAKAVELLNMASEAIRRQPGMPVQFSDSGTPAAERAAVRGLALDVAGHVPPLLRFSAAWNGRGHILVAPDVSRNLLASIDAYRFGRGDALALPIPTDAREDILRDDYDTLAHETHHSATPQYARRESEVTSTFEEAIASVFGRRDRARVSRASGADIPTLARDPSSAVDDAQLGWKPWSRAHLPSPPGDLVDTAEGRYVDGPRVVRDLLRAAGIDLRTREGHARAYDILQGRAAAHAPRRLADAIIEQHGIDRTHREQVVEHVRESVSSERGARHVTDLLAQLGGTPDS